MRQHGGMTEQRSAGFAAKDGLLRDDAGHRIKPMNAEPDPAVSAVESESKEGHGQDACAPLGKAAAAALEDDLDFGGVKLGERQAEACSMEEGCQSCQ